MESITAARNISGLEPMSVLHGIAPLCVPMTVSGDFADEVGNRAVPRIVSKSRGPAYRFAVGAARTVLYARTAADCSGEQYARYG